MRVREYRAAEDGEAAYRIRRLAFGGPRKPDPAWLEQKGGWTALVAEDGGAAAGYLRIRHYAQFFGGKAVPMGGLASVSVDPHARGGGVASALLDASLRRMHDDGFAVSALYPSVPPLYRSRGWEQAGTYQSVDLATASLPRRRGGGSRRADEADVPAIQAAYLRVASQVDGMLDRATAAFDQGDLLDLDIAVVVPGEDGVRGYLLADRPDGGRLIVHDLVADDAATAGTLLDLLASWSGQLETTSVRAVDPMVHDMLLSLPYHHEVSTQPWMLRVVDLPAAVAARGWPSAAVLRPLAVDLDVEDPHAPWQHGRCRIVCEDGEVRCEPGGSGAVRVSARALSAWFAGSASTSTLRRTGLLDADPGDAAALDALTGAQRVLRMGDAF